jgi:hypothetical protein
MSAAAEGLPASVQVRLVRHAKSRGLNPNLVMTRFAIERFLYRLSRSPHGDRFVLKGALLMLVWLGETLRPTRDADLLGSGEISEPSLTRMFTDVCELPVEPDGLAFLASSIRVAAIRVEDAYGGMRATLQARLGRARLAVQIDVGIGDAVTPEPVWLEYPTLLGLPRPRMRAYRPETAIAEKLHAMVVLGEVNSRMRDFFDIHALAQAHSFEGEPLVQAVRATFERRQTPVPDSLPVALTPAFGAVRQKVIQWQAFMNKSGGLTAPADLALVVGRIGSFLEPVLAAARKDGRVPLKWSPGGPWRVLSEDE